MPPVLPTTPSEFMQFLISITRVLGDVTYYDMLQALPWTLVAFAITIRTFSWEVQGIQRLRQIDPDSGEMRVTYKLHSLGDLAALWILVSWISQESQMLSVLLSPLVYGSMISIYRKVVQFRTPRDEPDA